MSDDDEKVGYGRPPKHARFKKGQSGNPKGRAPKSRNFDTIMANELDRKIRIKVAGLTKRITTREALAVKLIDVALRGNCRAMTWLVQYQRDAGISDPFGLTPGEDADLLRALEQIASKAKSTRRGKK